MDLTWLPPLIEFDAYGGIWEDYLNAIYDAFKKDFLHSKPIFKGTKLGLKRYPEIDGKACTFWHFISEGKDETKRIPDLRRCERIKWPKPIIECESCKEIKIWCSPPGEVSDFKLNLPILVSVD
jgi:hypothetical protein